MSQVRQLFNYFLLTIYTSLNMGNVLIGIDAFRNERSIKF